MPTWAPAPGAQGFLYVTTIWVASNSPVRGKPIQSLTAPNCWAQETKTGVVMA